MPPPQVESLVKPLAAHACLPAAARTIHDSLTLCQESLCF